MQSHEGYNRFAKVDYSTTAEKFTQFTVTLPLDLSSKMAERDK
jgi:hypothetical protein